LELKNLQSGLFEILFFKIKVSLILFLKRNIKIKKTYSYQ